MEKIFYKDNQSPNICSECGGVCCKKAPGLFRPSDFGLPGIKGEANLRQRFFKENIAIDWWEGDPRLPKVSYDSPDYIRSSYYLRPSVVGRENYLDDPSWTLGQCSNLTENGCLLVFEKRPAECKDLTPVQDKLCVSSISFPDKRQISVEWIPYHALIEKLREEKREYVERLEELKEQKDEEK